MTDIGFHASDLAALESMTPAEVHALTFAKASALAIQVDREVLRRQVERVLRSRHRQRLENDLLQAEAPHDMMRNLFGWNARSTTHPGRDQAQDRLWSAAPADAAGGRAPVVLLLTQH